MSVAADLTDIAFLLRRVYFRLDFVVFVVLADFAVFVDFAVFADLAVFADFAVFVDRIVLVDFCVLVDRMVLVDLKDFIDFTLLLSSSFRGRPRFFVDFAVVVDFASVFCGLSGFSVFRDFFDEYDLTVSAAALYIRF